MTFPTPPPPPTTPPPSWLPPGQPPPRRSSPLVPLLVVGAIALVMLMAGATAAILIVMNNSGAFSPVPPIRDTPPVVRQPPPDTPPETPPEAESGTPRPASGTSPARSDRARDGASGPGARLGSRVGGLAEAPPPPPPAMPIRAGGKITPVKIRNVAPIYPPIALSARVQGVVIIEATIDTRGKVADARVLRSIPLLDRAALDAVRQWEYEPMLLNGEPVPVTVTVTVKFSLK